MPAFYFNVCDGQSFVEAEESQDLPDHEAARREAVKGLRGLLAGDLLNGRVNLAMFIEIEDHEHKLLFTISVDDAVAMDAEPAARQAAGTERGDA